MELKKKKAHRQTRGTGRTEKREDYRAKLWYSHTRKQHKAIKKECGNQFVHTVIFSDMK